MPKACLQIEDDLLLTWGITGWSNDSAIDSRDAFEGPGKARDRARGSRCQGKWTRKQMAPGDPVAIVTASEHLVKHTRSSSQHFIGNASAGNSPVPGQDSRDARARSRYHDCKGRVQGARRAFNRAGAGCRLPREGWVGGRKVGLGGYVSGGKPARPLILNGYGKCSLWKIW
jgi:hypothetical protein